MSGKGDTPRPYSVSPNAYATNWERTFGGRGKVYGSCGHELACLPTDDEVTILAGHDRQGQRTLVYATLCLACYQEAQADNRLLATLEAQNAWLQGTD